jgi:hypothetical protein
MYLHATEAILKKILHSPIEVTETALRFSNGHIHYTLHLIDQLSAIWLECECEIKQDNQRTVMSNIASMTFDSPAGSMLVFNESQIFARSGLWLITNTNDCVAMLLDCGEAVIAAHQALSENLLPQAYHYDWLAKLHDQYPDADEEPIASPYHPEALNFEVPRRNDQVIKCTYQLRPQWSWINLERFATLDRKRASNYAWLCNKTNIDYPGVNLFQGLSGDMDRRNINSELWVSLPDNPISNAQQKALAGQLDNACCQWSSLLWDMGKLTDFEYYD